MSRNFWKVYVNLVSLVAFVGTLSAAGLIVDHSKWVSVVYPPIETQYVLSRDLEASDWWSNVKVMNPALTKFLAYKMVANIKVRAVGTEGDVGSQDSFIQKARERAGELGANLLNYDNSVVTRTGRLVSFNFTAYRVTFKDHLLPPAEFARLELLPQEGQVLEARVERWNEETGEVQETGRLARSLLSDLPSGTTVQILLKDEGWISGTFLTFDQDSGFVRVKTEDIIKALPVTSVMEVK